MNSNAFMQVLKRSGEKNEVTARRLKPVVEQDIPA